MRLPSMSVDTFGLWGYNPVVQGTYGAIVTSGGSAFNCELAERKGGFCSDSTPEPRLTFVVHHHQGD